MGSFLKPTFNRWNLLWITWLDETYWVIGATLGGLIGPFLIFNLKKKKSMTLLQQIIMVSAGVAATMLTRFIPFVAFRPGKPTHKYILYLGKVLPASVFALLVVYCLRHIHSFSADSVAQLAAVAFTILIHVWKRNMMWSIAAGTLCYMLLIRI
ncbi:branched-chain amino acid transporter permease [Segatella copri]|mgnify:FL=1|uniref:branched-chain amino acid transporter permease n=1 Tax=Segatella copri TaxID=165179 RepID=UPI001931E012|nr:AzlD domain-containing protein [Segatella copri]